ncbi:hypothetical protein C8R46DRAFT_1123502 [Mycena filopes]|nr:hypothetical protein C8R46DRAFT_1123502 [Mycena filopes]
MSVSAPLRARLAQLDEELTVLLSTWQSLTAERENVMATLDAVSYPILTLPTEITTEIFLHCVSAEQPIHLTDCAPLVLTKVCRSWRDICLSTSALWAGVRIDESSHASQNIQFRDEFLERWFSRAGRQLLDLNVYTPPSHATARTWSFLAGYSSQWRTLQLGFNQGSSSDDLSPAIDCIRGCVPALTKITMSVWCTSPLWATAFQDAPSLRHVRLSNCARLWIALPWDQLTHLEFVDGALPAFAQLLQLTPNLEVLEVSCRKDPEPHLAMGLPVSAIPHLQPTPPPTPVLLPLLHTLRFGFIHTPAPTVFSHLILPALTTLEATEGLPPVALPSLLALADRSSWSLHTLRLRNIEDYAVATQLLRARSWPALEVVELRGYMADPAELHPLLGALGGDTDDDGGGEFLPALRVLRISGCRGWVSLASLPDVLASRWYGRSNDHGQGLWQDLWRNEREKAKLETFHLSFAANYSGGMEAEIYDAQMQLQHLVEDGMDVVVVMNQ